jgi:hypothetical protein
MDHGTLTFNQDGIDGRILSDVERPLPGVRKRAMNDQVGSGPVRLFCDRIGWFSVGPLSGQKWEKRSFGNWPKKTDH